MTMTLSKDAAGRLEKVIKDFINHSSENNLGSNPPERAFGDPIVGFSRGDDPIFEAYKGHIGPFHLTPFELFSGTLHEKGVSSGELSVISWVLPQTEATKEDNQKETFHPAERWVRARFYGEEVNNKLRRLVVDALAKTGCRAVAPALSPLWERKVSERFGFASTWSERHAAYASGLGTFGLCDGLITPVGKAMRVGSVVARIETDPAPRPYTDHHQYCLFFTEGICGKCISRCPAGALSEDGHDKVKCSEHIQGLKEYIKGQYKFPGYGCGLCQTKVPCESKIPEAKDV